MHQHASTSERNCRLSEDHAVEDGTHFRSRRDQYIKYKPLWFENREQPFDTLSKSSLVSVFRDPENFLTLGEFFTNENQPVSAAADSNVNSRIDNIRKRKALQMRNSMAEGGKSTNIFKIERSSLCKAGIERSLKTPKIDEQMNDKNSDENMGNINWKENFTTGSVSCGIWSENGMDKKQDESIYCGEPGHDEGPRGSLREGNWNGNLPVDRNDYEGSDENELKVKWKGNILTDQGSSINRDETTKCQGGDDEVPGGSKTKWNKHAGKSQGNDKKQGEDENGAGRNGKSFTDKGDIDGWFRSGDEIKRNGNFVTDPSGGDDGEKSDENKNKVKCNGNELINQNKAEKADANRDQRNGTEIHQNENEVQRNKNGIQRNKSGVQRSENRVQRDEKGVRRNENGTQQNENEVQRDENGTQQNESGVQRNENGTQRNKNGVQRNKGGVQRNGNGNQQNENRVQRNENGTQQNENGAQRNGNARKHQNGTEESNNGFPRKTKTLGLLSRKFLMEVLEYDCSGDEKINLEAIACSMKVEKRRIYDVVNVMEALGAMEKSHKSFYTWKGLDKLPSILYTLKIEAERECVYQKVLMTQHMMTQFMEVANVTGNASASLDDAGPSQTSDDNDISAAEQSVSPESSNGKECVASKQSNSKKKGNKRQRGLNSLTYLCKYFFKILIAGLDQECDYKVSLDVASTILIKDPETDVCKPPDRSRCRRIYDVANVLISLRLIERRMFTFGTKKIPLFVYCGPEIIKNGKFDFFHHLRFNKLSLKLKNSEEKKAYEVEEENLETFFLNKNKKRQKAELSNNVDEPAAKHGRIEQADSIQENADVEKENVPIAMINQVIPSSRDSNPMPILRPQPQKATDLTSILASQTFSPFNNLESFVQQSTLAQFMPYPISSQGFTPFDANMMLLNSGNMLQNITPSRLSMQQNNFNYLPYPLTPVTFLQQPQIVSAGTSYPAYNNTNNSFIHPANALRSSSVFNIDSILGNRGTRQSNRVDDEMKLATSIAQHVNRTRDQSALFQQSADFLLNYAAMFDPTKQ